VLLFIGARYEQPLPRRLDLALDLDVA
jgi:hypothetical protein